MKAELEEMEQALLAAQPHDTEVIYDVLLAVIDIMKRGQSEAVKEKEG